MRISFIGFPRNQCRWFWVHFWQDEDEIKTNAVESSYELEGSSVRKHHSRWEFLSLVFQETNVDDSESISGKMKTKWRWMQLNLVTNRSLPSENTILDENFFSLVFQETNVDDSESISGKMKTKWRWMQLNLVRNRSLPSENTILDENFFHWFSKKPMSMILSPFLARWRRNEDECSCI